MLFWKVSEELGVRNLGFLTQLYNLDACKFGTEYGGCKDSPLEAVSFLGARSGIQFPAIR